MASDFSVILTGPRLIHLMERRFFVDYRTMMDAMEGGRPGTGYRLAEVAGEVLQLRVGVVDPEFERFEKKVRDRRFRISGFASDEDGVLWKLSML